MTPLRHLLGEGRLPDDVELTDGVVALRRWSPGDAPALTEIWQDAELQRRFGVEAPVTRASIVAYLDGVVRRWREGVHVPLAVVVAGALVGGCDLDHLERARPDLGYWLAPGERGNGYATRAAQLLLDWAGAALGITVVDLEVEADNLGSIAVATRLGFARVPGVETADGARGLLLYRRTISR